VVAAMLLGDEGDAAGGGGLETDCLVIDVAFVCARVLVGEVERVSRELDAAAAPSLDSEGALVLGQLPQEWCGNV